MKEAALDDKLGIELRSIVEQIQVKETKKTEFKIVLIFLKMIIRINCISHSEVIS